MEKQMVWDTFVGDEVEMPEEMQAFLAEVEATCRKYGLSLTHEDEQGGFIVEVLKERNLNWLAGASKRYTREVDPVTGVTLAPAWMGQSCPAWGASCLNCRFRRYCYSPFDRRTQNKLQEILNG